MNGCDLNVPPVGPRVELRASRPWDRLDPRGDRPRGARALPGFDLRAVDPSAERTRTADTDRVRRAVSPDRIPPRIDRARDVDPRVRLRRVPRLSRDRAALRSGPMDPRPALGDGGRPRGMDRVPRLRSDPPSREVRVLHALRVEAHHLTATVGRGPHPTGPPRNPPGATYPQSATRWAPGALGNRRRSFIAPLRS